MGLAKRIQAPPVLAVKRRAFGFDHRESQMGVRYTRKYQELKKKLLSGS
jgi:NAD+ synthase (glutamine-hydrolysing)